MRSSHCWCFYSFVCSAEAFTGCSAENRTAERRRKHTRKDIRVPVHRRRRHPHRHRLLRRHHPRPRHHRAIRIVTARKSAIKGNKSTTRFIQTKCDLGWTLRSLDRNGDYPLKRWLAVCFSPSVVAVCEDHLLLRCCAYLTTTEIISSL